MTKRRNRKHREKTNFRRIQVLSDLQAATTYLFAVWPDVANEVCDGFPVLTAAMADEIGFRFQGDVPDNLKDRVLLAAASPDDGIPAFAIATVLLASDALTSNQPAERFEWHWDEFADHYRGLPASVRAALMNAFRYGVQSNKLSDAVSPSLEDCLTSKPAAFQDALIRIAKSMTEEERLSVAHADSYRRDGDVEKHLAALNDVLARADCRFPDDTWFPLEPVELVAWSPEAMGFVPCTALLLIDALGDGTFHANDGQGGLSSRWGLNYDAYCKLPGELSAPILRAFRFLYETADEFDLSSWVWTAEKRLMREVTPIPWLPPESTSHPSPPE